MLKGDCPSSNQSDAIQAKLDDCEWEELSLAESGNAISDFVIDTNIFETSGEAYSEIASVLSNL